MNRPLDRLRHHVTGAIERGEAEPVRAIPYWERPCAASGLTSYRYRGAYGWIMIGATDQHDALREVCRSTHDHSAAVANLEVWDTLAGQYVKVQP